MATATMTAGNLPATATPTPGNLPAAPASASAVATTAAPGAGAAGANAPALVPGADGQAAATGTGLVPLTGNRLIDNTRQVLAQPAVRRALPAILTLMVLIVMALVYMWMQSVPYRAVMPGLNEADQQTALEALRTANYKPHVDPDNGQLMVPADRYHEARMFLASQGVPKVGPTGLEALKDQSSMTTSQFMEQVRVNAAMEQELARSITQIGAVQAARVHLATPKQSLFVRDRVTPKASVVVTPFKGRVLAEPQVKAIVHLVASSVPYMNPENVTVVDNQGNYLTDPVQKPQLGLTGVQADHKAQLEELYRNRINQILGPVVGEHNVSSQVYLTLDFTQVESASEDYDAGGKGPKTRSEMTAEEREAKRNAEGVPGALTNTAPANPDATLNTQADPQKGSDTTGEKITTRSTRNFEMDRAVKYVRAAPGQVQRVTVAVVVNERPALPGADGKAPAEGASRPYTPEEMARFQDLVKGVVGFDPKRGDVVSVVPAKFEGAIPDDTIPWYLQDDVHLAIKSGLLALMFIAFLLVVVRPVLRSMGIGVKPPEPVKEEAAEEAPEVVPDGELTEEDKRMIQIGEGETLEEIKAKLKPKKSSISIDMLDTANTYDDKVALIRMLVAEDSGRVANVLKGMIRI